MAAGAGRCRRRSRHCRRASVRDRESSDVTRPSPNERRRNYRCRCGGNRRVPSAITDASGQLWATPRPSASARWLDRSFNGRTHVVESLDQRAEVYDLKLQDLRSGLTRTIRQLTARKPGPPEKVRGVQGREYVIKGTRVPTRKVVALVDEGWTADDVVAAIPHLTRADVRRAVRFERERRDQRTA
jgi:uncharacterized protein (DUF433 family)